MDEQECVPIPNSSFTWGTEHLDECVLSISVVLEVLLLMIIGMDVSMVRSTKKVQPSGNSPPENSPLGFRFHKVGVISKGYCPKKDLYFGSSRFRRAYVPPCPMIHHPSSSDATLSLFVKPSFRSQGFNSLALTALLA